MGITMVKKTASKKNTSVQEPVPAPPAPEPVVLEQKPVEDSPVEVMFKDVLNDLNEQKTLITNTINNVKKLQKDWAKELKANKKKKGGDPSKKREPSGFAKPTKISKELCDFLNV